MPRHIVIIGATSTIAHHCARLWAQQDSTHFTLVGRNKQSLKRIADDITARCKDSVVVTETVDFLDANAIKKLTQKISKKSDIDTVLIAHGVLSNQSQCEQDIAVAQNDLSINAVSPIIWAESFAQHLQTQNQGTLIVIGSVAGDRGRKSNYIYGAGKALLDTAINGMQHRFANSPVNVILVKPGPTKTNMTQGKNIANMTSPESVAHDIIQGAKHKKEIIYTPKKWGLIMFIIRNLPKFIFNKINI